jgi:hypothetical protein
MDHGRASAGQHPKFGSSAPHHLRHVRTFAWNSANRIRWSATTNGTVLADHRQLSREDFLSGGVGMCPSHDFVWLVDGGAVIEHQYRDKERAGQGMNFTADL